MLLLLIDKLTAVHLLLLCNTFVLITFKKLTTFLHLIELYVKQFICKRVLLKQPNFKQLYLNKFILNRQDLPNKPLTRLVKWSPICNQVYEGMWITVG